jgi:hypothetical protein
LRIWRTYCRLPDEHSVTTFREIVKIVVPLLALLMAWQANTQDRAYVLADGMSIELNANSAAPRVVASVKNLGKTPALEVTVTSRCRVVRTLPTPFGELSKYSLGRILATDEVLCNLRRATYRTGYDRLKGRKILYRDVFDLDHRTLLRRFVGGKAGLNGSKMANSNLPDEGEEAD